MRDTRTRSRPDGALWGEHKYDVDITKRGDMPSGKLAIGVYVIPISIFDDLSRAIALSKDRLSEQVDATEPGTDDHNLAMDASNALYEAMYELERWLDGQCEVVTTPARVFEQWVRVLESSCELPEDDAYMVIRDTCASMRKFYLDQKHSGRCGEHYK